MIRLRLTDWRVQVCANGCWQDHHVGTRAGPAIKAYAELNTYNKRLLRNGRPLCMSAPEELDLTLEDA